MSEDVSTVDYAQAEAAFVLSGATVGGFFVNRPRFTGSYVIGDSAFGHHFLLTRKPGRIERFFVRHLLGLIWVDSAC
jgi:hypothetical protein